jgi:fluoride exporter
MSPGVFQVLMVAAGGAAGAVARFLLGMGMASFVPGPWPTLVVNLLGSFFIGLIIGALAGSEWFESWGRFLLVTGLLGGFTTYSAFAMDAVVLIGQGHWLSAGTYVMATAIGCVLAAWLGVRIVSG